MSSTTTDTFHAYAGASLDVVPDVDAEVEILEDGQPVDDLDEQGDELPALLDDDLVPVLDDDDEDELGTVEIHVSDRPYDQFDWEKIVADLNLRDIPDSLAVLEAHRLPFVRAARAAEKKNPHADFYNVANGPLFARRINLKNKIRALESRKRQPTQTQALELFRARRELETLTELVVLFNYGMTRKYVKQFTSNTSREDSLDFQGAANVGLMIAIDSFDPTRGKFGTWAYKPIQRAVLKAVRDADFKNMNEGDFEKRPKVRKAFLKLAGPDGEHKPSFEQVAAEAGVHIDLVRRILAAPHLESIHHHVGEEGDTEFGDLIPDANAAFEESVISALGVAALLEHGLVALDPREHYVLVRVYGLDGETPDALADIGNQLQLSREAVRQIRGKALAKLLHPTTLRKLVRGGRA